jgi:hypothetical protein
MGETNSPSVAHVGYGISPLSRVKLKILTTLELRNIVTHEQMKENLYVCDVRDISSTHTVEFLFDSRGNTIQLRNYVIFLYPGLSPRLMKIKMS